MRSPRLSNGAGAGAGAARLVRHRVWRPLNVLACWVCITLLLLAELHPCSRHTPTSVFYAYLSQPTARHAYVDLSPLGVPYGLTVRGGFTAPALTRLHPARHARSAIISELRDAKPPTAISSTRGTARTERPLLLVGVFSTAAKRQARMLVRQSLKLQNGAWSRFVEIRFVLGQPDSNEEQRALAEEMDEEGDILLLDEPENMNEGKTYHFLRAIAALPEESAPRFVMKADDDTLLVLRNWVDLLLGHERHGGGRPLYAGACPEGSCGARLGYSPYFAGFAYALSSDLVRWMGRKDVKVPQATLDNHEDVLVGQMVCSLPPEEARRLVRLSVDQRAGTWEGAILPWRRDTALAVHHVKTEEQWDYFQRLLL